MYGADLNILDVLGRNALHWAAYKGYSDTIRLLVVLEASYTQADKEGCTPLHWAVSALAACLPACLRVCMHVCCSAGTLAAAACLEFHASGGAQPMCWAARTRPPAHARPPC